MYTFDTAYAFDAADLTGSEQLAVDHVVEQLIARGVLRRGGTLDEPQWQAVIVGVMKELTSPSPRTLNTSAVAAYLRSGNAPHTYWWDGPTPVITIPPTTKRAGDQGGGRVDPTSYTPGGAESQLPVDDGDRSAPPSWMTWILPVVTVGGLLWLLSRQHRSR